MARHKIPKKSLDLHQLHIFYKIPWKARAPAVQYFNPQEQICTAFISPPPHFTSGKLEVAA